MTYFLYVNKISKPKKNRFTQQKSRNMTKARYHQLLADEEVIKVRHELDFQCTTPCKRYNIGVYFNPAASVRELSEFELNKPLVMVYPGDPTQAVPEIVIDKRMCIMMFSNEPDHAFTYHLDMDCEKGVAHLKVDEMPEKNEGFITERERKGIRKAILPAHKKLMDLER